MSTTPGPVISVAGSVERPESWRVQRTLAPLVGIPYDNADCWQIVVKALELLGVKWPWEFSDALAAESSLAADRSIDRTPFIGDIIVMRDALSDRDHVGMYIGTGLVLHTTKAGGRSRLDRMATLRKVGVLKRILAVRAFREAT